MTSIDITISELSIKRGILMFSYSLELYGVFRESSCVCHHERTDLRTYYRELAGSDILKMVALRDTLEHMQIALPPVIGRIYKPGLTVVRGSIVLFNGSDTDLTVTS